jgi:hypothetical protein
MTRTTKRKAPPPRTKAEDRAKEIRDMPKPLGIAAAAQLEAERAAGFAVGERIGYENGKLAGIQLCKNLVTRRKNDHGGAAAKAWFPGGHNIRQDECMAIELELIDL